MNEYLDKRKPMEHIDIWKEIEDMVRMDLTVIHQPGHIKDRSEMVAGNIEVRD